LQEIGPQLDKLRRDKENYEKYMTMEGEKAVLWKQIVAYEYHSTEKGRKQK